MTPVNWNLWAFWKCNGAPKRPFQVKIFLWHLYTSIWHPLNLKIRFCSIMNKKSIKMTEVCLWIVWFVGDIVNSRVKVCKCSYCVQCIQTCQCTFPASVCRHPKFYTFHARCRQKKSRIFFMKNCSHSDVWDYLWYLSCIIDAFENSIPPYG